jgi:hypothetical protein
MQTLIGEPLPHDEVLESTVIASALYDQAQMAVLLSQVRPDDFYHSGHGRILAALATANGDPSAAMIGMEDVDRDLFLQTKTGAAFHLDISPYVQKLLDLSARRRIIEQSERAIQAARNPEMPLSETVEGLKNAIVMPSRELWHPEETRVLITRMLSTEPDSFNFVVPGLLPKGVCGFLYGEGGSYKSLAALWLCIQRAAGFVANSKWLDRFEISGPAGRSMFCSVEDQEIDIHHRIRAIVERFSEMRSDVSRQSIEDAIAANFHCFPRELWMRDGFEHIVDVDGKPTIKADLVSQYAIAQEIDLIVLDTLSRLSLVDENDNNGAARLVACLERLRDTTGAAVLVIAHSGKIGRTAKTDTHGQNGLRGASALMDNSRFGLWFRSLSSKGGPAKLEILNAKTFRARRVEPFKVTVDYPALTLCDDDEPVEDLVEAVVEDVRANPGTTQRGIRGRLKKNATSIKLALKDADEEGLVVYKGKGKGYFING